MSICNLSHFSQIFGSSLCIYGKVVNTQNS